jgi:hypothetical protein
MHNHDTDIAITEQAIKVIDISNTDKVIIKIDTERNEIIWYSPDGPVTVNNSPLLAIAFYDLIMQMTDFKYDGKQLDAKVKKQYDKFLKSDKSLKMRIKKWFTTVGD